MVDTHFRERVERLVREYAPGWNVTIHEEDSRGSPHLMVEITHPLSAGVMLVEGDAVEDLTPGHVESWLQQESARQEIDTIADAPEAVHPDVVKAIRAYADVFQWSRTEVGAVSALVASCGGLDDAEESWLRDHVGVDTSEDQ